MAVQITNTTIRADHAAPPVEGAPRVVIADITFDYDDGHREVDRWCGKVPTGADAVSHIQSFSARLIAAKVEKEINRNVALIQVLGSYAHPSVTTPQAAADSPKVRLRVSTLEENGIALRNAYAQADKGSREVIMIADFLNAMTDAQKRTAFGVTQAQLNNTINPKLQNAALIAASLRAETGA